MKQMNINSSSISCKEYQQYCINFSLKAANVNFAMELKRNVLRLKANFFVVVV